jgi:ArsR family transcriptional regulator, arsenate/arsenite/antimonite-responsive transcriptional repressor
MDHDANWRAGGGAMATHAPMSLKARQATAERLRILGKEKSIALIEILAGGEATVQELADRIGVSHQNASHHLSLLREAGVVARRIDGPTSIYALEDWAAWWIIKQVSGLVDEKLADGRD